MGAEGPNIPLPLMYRSPRALKLPLALKSPAMVNLAVGVVVPIPTFPEAKNDGPDELNLTQGPPL